MGTNFYFITDSREKRDKWFAPGRYELTDEPRWGYLAHIAKTSCGWVPLFEKHKGITCVKDLKLAYDDGLEIIDEYFDTYTWEQFEKRVVQFADMASDPLSHLKYMNGTYQYLYYVDPDGYEFCYETFA